MESTKNQNNVTNESNTGLGLDAAHHRVEADASPYAGEDEEMVENSVGVSDDENSVDGNYKTIERSTGGDLIASWAGTVEGTPVDTEPESDEAAKTLRFNALCQRAMKFAEDAATSPGTYEVALRVLEKAVEVVESAKKGVAVAEEDISMNEIVLHKFQQAKTRGRDPNPSGEKPQKRSRKCIICKGSAHDKRNCPTLKGSSATDNSEGNPDKKRQGSLEGTSESSDNNTALALGNEPDGGGKELVSGPGPKKVLGKVGRTSTYHGVTRHRWTGRFEAHLWDNNWVKEGQKRKGKLVYLGGYDEEEKAAKAYDLAALKYWGLSPTLKLNFPASDYEKELESVTHMGREEFINYMRRKSSGFSRGASIYRGVTRRQHDGKWQARIGRTPGNKDEFYYLGTYDTEREAAEAYDVAALEIRGLNAVTNFDISNYCQGGWKELEQFCKIKKIAQDWVNRAETIKQLTLGSEGGLNKPT